MLKNWAPTVDSLIVYESRMLLCLIYSSIPCFFHCTNNDIQRVEPAFWWTEMKNPVVQLLIYGKNISQSTVSLDYPGVVVKEVQKVKKPKLFISNTRYW
jgi:hypothetical protein